VAGVIRREQFAAGRPFSFADLEAQGREILRRAEAQAQELLHAAERRGQQLAEQQRQVAYRAGLAEGRAAGQKQAYEEARAQAVDDARAQVTELITALTACLSEFEESKRRLLAAAESGLIELALAIARRVCKLEVGTSTAAARANARALLEMARHADDAELHLHPDEYAQLHDLAPEFTAGVDQLAHVRLVSDASVSRGGCRLSMGSGEIDATLETQLDRIAATLRPASADEPQAAVGQADSTGAEGGA